MLLKVPLNTNKTGQHAVSYNQYIVESGIEYKENRSQCNSYIMATSFSDGRGRNTQIEPPTMGKQLVKSLAAASRVHPFFNFQSCVRTHVVLVI
jgi:hypothetical protein